VEENKMAIPTVRLVLIQTGKIVIKKLREFLPEILFSVRERYMSFPVLCRVLQRYYWL